MGITRRQFLKSLASGIAVATLPMPLVFDRRRPPFVESGELVDYIGGRRPSGMIGGASVKEILPWDGTAYPVILRIHSYPPKEIIHYDCDLFNFIKDLPPRFWHNPANKIYPNVHTWARVQRFGEDVESAIQHLNFAGTNRFIAKYRAIIRRAA